MAWSSSARPRRADGVLDGAVDGQLVVLQPATGEYAGLDGTAAHVWALIERPTTFRQLVDTLVATYDVGRSQCAAEVAECLEGLRRQGLVELGASG
jgi:hypothetical protein